MTAAAASKLVDPNLVENYVLAHKATMNRVMAACTELIDATHALMAHRKRNDAIVNHIRSESGETAAALFAQNMGLDAQVAARLGQRFSGTELGRLLFENGAAHTHYSPHK